MNQFCMIKYIVYLFLRPYINSCSLSNSPWLISVVFEALELGLLICCALAVLCLAEDEADAGRFIDLVSYPYDRLRALEALLPAFF